MADGWMGRWGKKALFLIDRTAERRRRVRAPTNRSEWRPRHHRRGCGGLRQATEQSRYFHNHRNELGAKQNRPARIGVAS